MRATVFLTKLRTENYKQYYEHLLHKLHYKEYKQNLITSLLNSAY